MWWYAGRATRSLDRALSNRERKREVELPCSNGPAHNPDVNFWWTSVPLQKLCLRKWQIFFLIIILAKDSIITKHQIHKKINEWIGSLRTKTSERRQFKCVTLYWDCSKRVFTVLSLRATLYERFLSEVTFLKAALPMIWLNQDRRLPQLNAFPSFSFIFLTVSQLGFWSVEEKTSLK